jgi:hypothetical protein
MSTALTPATLASAAENTAAAYQRLIVSSDETPARYRTAAALAVQLADDFEAIALVSGYALAHGWRVAARRLRTSAIGHENAAAVLDELAALA